MKIDLYAFRNCRGEADLGAFDDLGDHLSPEARAEVQHASIGVTIVNTIYQALNRGDTGSRSIFGLWEILNKKDNQKTKRPDVKPAPQLLTPAKTWDSAFLIN